MSGERKMDFSAREFEVSQEAAFRALQSDANLILKLCKGNARIAEEISGAVVLDISNSNKTLNLDSFAENIKFRLSIYRRKLIDILRKFDVLGESVRYDSHLEEVQFQEGEAEKTSPNFEKEIQDYIEDILSDAEDLLSEGKLNKTTLDRMKFIIQSRLLRKTLKEIGQEFDVSESRMTQILKKIRELFPKYEDFWNIIFEKDIKQGKDISTSKEKELSFERMQRVIISLLDKENLSDWEKGVLLCGHYYMNTISHQQLIVGLKQLGIVVNDRNLTYLRKTIEQMAGQVPISGLTLHKKSKV
jgi:predicted DNA-binding protein YlxM (UPF0122 family)